MENNLSIREILEWYVTAGVDETFGEVPFGLEAPKPKAEPVPRPALTTRAEDSVAPRGNDRSGSGDDFGLQKRPRTLRGSADVGRTAGDG